MIGRDIVRQYDDAAKVGKYVSLRRCLGSGRLPWAGSRGPKVAAALQFLHLGKKSAGQRRTPSGGLVVLVAKQLAGSAVEEVESGARRAGHRLVFMLASALPVRPVLHLKIGSGANEYQIHSALIGASRHETMIWRKILPP